MSFSHLGLSPPLIRALTERGYGEPTPVQEAVIPVVRRGGDVWAQAQTGSGKTAAFALPILEGLLAPTLNSERRSGALILVPTRELAVQIGEAFRSYAQFFPVKLKIITAIGGVSINPQMLALRGSADVLVATPGRLLDLVERHAVRLAGFRTLVLDEADRLLALGFADELGRIVAQLPPQRQSLLISATFPPEVEALANELLRDPVKIVIESTPTDAPMIVERAIEVDVSQRTQVLRHLLNAHAWSQVLVFVATKYATEHVAEKLRRTEIAAGALHGELSQGARAQAMADFRSGKLRVLVATDLAARGIDIAQLSAVVNFDLPRSAVDYTHRIGRTGRAGESGVAISFVSASTHAHFSLIAKRHDRPISREQLAGFEPTETELPDSASTGGVKGKRKSKKDKLREAEVRAANPLAQEVKVTPASSFRWHRSPTARRSR